MIDVSIIIPVYNTPKEQLNRCFLSINKLTDFSYEVIIIDDGSNNQTQNFCIEYCENNHLFKYYRKKNEGVSVARNYGITLAQGKYIMFADSDDEIISDNILKEHIECNYDVVLYDMTLRNDKRDTVWHALSNTIDNITMDSVIYEVATSDHLNSPCAKLILLEFIRKNHIFFATDMKTGEDLNFFLDILFNNPKLYYYPTSVYLYYKDYSTRLNRIKNYPDIMIENSIRIHKRLLSLINIQLKNSNIKEFCMQEIKKSLIKSMFNYESDLIKLNLLNRNRENLIRQEVKKLSSNKELGYSIKECIERMIIVYNLSYFIIILSYIRYIYINIIKK